MKTGWEVKKLDNIIESNVIGLTKNSSEQNIHHEFKYVKMNNITKDNCFDLSKYTCVNAEKNEIEKYRLSNDDFLFNTRNSYELVGKTCLFKYSDNEVILYNNNIMRIRFLKSINPFFINYAFSTDDVINKLDRIKSGTTNVSAIYYKDLKNLEILIPPLPEQQRIVTILDEAFAAIAQAKANAEQNLKNAKELFDSYLQSVFENKGEGWVHSRLGDICQINDGTHFSPKNTSDGEYMYVTAKNIKPYFIDLTKISFISEKDHKDIYARCSPVKGDVLYIKDGATAGIAAINTLENEFSLLSSVALLKCSSIILNTFLVHYMNSIIGKNNFLGYIGGAAITRLTLIKIKNVCFYLPPLEDQQAIVQKLDALSAETKQLEALYQQKINDLDELKKSILQKAFAGELNTNALVA